MPNEQKDAPKVHTCDICKHETPWDEYINDDDDESLCPKCGWDGIGRPGRR